MKRQNIKTQTNVYIALLPPGKCNTDFPRKTVLLKMCHYTVYQAMLQTKILWKAKKELQSKSRTVREALLSAQPAPRATLPFPGAAQMQKSADKSVQTAFSLLLREPRRRERGSLP